MNSIQDAALLSAGMKTLRDTFGTVRAEIFITLIKQKGFDYTEWRRNNLWTGMSSEEISDHAIKIIDKNYENLPKSIQNAISSSSI